MAADVHGGWAMPIHTKATTKKTPYSCRFCPPYALRKAMRANAGGRIARLADLGHRSHGAIHNVIPITTAVAYTAATAARSAPGAGSGTRARPRRPEPA